MCATVPRLSQVLLWVANASSLTSALVLVGDTDGMDWEGEGEMTQRGQKVFQRGQVAELRIARRTADGGAAMWLFDRTVTEM